MYRVEAPMLYYQLVHCVTLASALIGLPPEPQA